MNIVHDISKKDLTEIKDIDFDKRGKKIKVREVNYTNLLQHIKRVPMISDSNYVYQILPASNDEYVSGVSRAINVKEHMLNSIAKKAIVMPSNRENENDGVVINVPVDKSIITDVDTYFEQISSERQGLLNDKIEAEKAVDKVNNSSKLLNELSVKETEEQKKYEEKQKKLDNVNQKIVKAIKAQMETLVATREKYRLMLEENSKIEMENQEKIIQSQSRIAQYEQDNTNLEDDIARQQEILNALLDFENNDINEFSQFENNNDVVSRRVA